MVTIICCPECGKIYSYSDEGTKCWEKDCEGIITKQEAPPYGKIWLHVPIGAKYDYDKLIETLKKDGWIIHEEKKYVSKEMDHHMNYYEIRRYESD